MKHKLAQWLFIHRNDFILPLVIFISIFSIGWISAQNEQTRIQNERQSDSVRLAVICDAQRLNISQLEADVVNNELLREIAMDLGLPLEPREPIVIPEVPAECEGL